MRTAFIKQLVEEAEHNDSIFLLVGDLGFSVVEPFAEKFPDRFLNVGIAEQNMAGIAAGLAKEGYNVFTYSIGNFPTLRCLEQIRYDVCYHNLSVKVVAVGGGYSYGPLGASHHTTEDIGTLRTIPNLTVCSPGDPLEAKAITTMLCNSSSPGYLRLGKAGETIVHNSLALDTNKMIPVIDGKETVVLATGGILAYAKNYITQNNLNWGLYSVPFIKPFDEATLETLAHKYPNFITIEEHQLSSGFGSAVLESMNSLYYNKKIKTFPNIRRIGIPDIFIDYAGSQDYLRNQAGLNF